LIRYKQLSSTKSLISVGAEILRVLDEPKTVSRVWTELQRYYVAKYSDLVITYDWFVLALDLLYAMEVITLADGRLQRI
jgi:hypothetical protein